MAIRIKLVDTAAEAEQLFRLRHRVYVEEMDYASSSRGGYLFDRFDAVPGVANFVALSGSKVIAGERVLIAEHGDTPAAEYFDFGAHAQAITAGRVASVSMLVIEPGFRRGPLTTWLNGVAHTWAADLGVRHAVAPLAPRAEEMARRLGYALVADRFFHEELQLHVAPMALDLESPGAALARFMELHRAPPEGARHVFFEAGEPMLHAGDERLLTIRSGRAALELEVVAPRASRGPTLDRGARLDGASLLDMCGPAARIRALDQVSAWELSSSGKANALRERACAHSEPGALQAAL